jgi:small basic protein
MCPTNEQNANAPSSPFTDSAVPDRHLRATDREPETSIQYPRPAGIGQQQFARPGTPHEFSVPRRYDLATLMAVTMAYACLFGALRALGAPPEVVIWVAGFLTTVGAAQAILFGGRSPRAASVLAGIGFMVATYVVLMAIYGLPDFCFLLAALPFGAMLGYPGGVIVAGVFLVAHYLRCLWPSNRKSNA